ncbi:Archaemetzincin-2 [Colletotrichum sojae]|uniref:Archaemetzincin-2 n=1 Tax=Colletotrichum sojae TaxID=2175907 RepID=A0A8H6IQY4_9PEZI|nr:Archaemetzincin-2 [Colletotrichum sojae]
MAPAKKKTCTHQALCLDASDHGRAAIGFQRAPAGKRIAAATASAGKVDPADPGPDESTFPGPLVLPDDELALNPKYPPQSLRSWARGGYRNKITPERKTLYVAGPPGVGEAEFMKGWEVPDVDEWVHPDDVPRLAHPGTEDVIAYLEAFYHPLPVKRLPTVFKFVPWDDKKKHTKGTPGMVGLAAEGSDVAVGIRARPAPDGIARGQLNLGDVLDALAGVMPKDAYAAVMLCEQDLYDDEEDEFCCGRAFGGSRISVVSGFRYRPVLDVVYGIEGAHCWPAAHCGLYVGRVCEEAAAEENGEEKGKKRKRGGRIAADGDVVMDVKKRPGTAMGAAVAAARGALVPKTKAAEEGMWFARVARTAAHELGHCFGMDHCVYYACSMQGSAGLNEDGRQPPYLCPVCEGKFVYGVGEMGVVQGCKFGKWEVGREQEVRMERMRAMRGFCERWKGVGMFTGFGGWLGVRMREEGRAAGV